MGAGGGCPFRVRAVNEFGYGMEADATATPGGPGPGGGCDAGAGMAGTLIPVLALWGMRRRRE